MTNLVLVENNQVVASSRVVAENFEKRHDNVIRDIENLKISLLNFEEYFHKTTYINDRGREYPEYLMTRDGFTLLAMGFTGSKAIQFKLQYIEAFNKMEEELKALAAPSYMIADPIERAKAWIAEQEKVQQLELENKIKDQQIAEYQPKVDYADTILQSKDTVSTTQIAKDYGMSARKLNQLLYVLNVQFNQSGQWLLYSKYQAKGYTQSSTIKVNGRSVLSTRWTQKGRLFLHQLLLDNGIYANVEAPEDYDVNEVLSGIE